MTEMPLELKLLPVSLADNLCTDCGNCLNACPTAVFERDPVTKRVQARYASDCHTCYLCVPDCPTGAIVVHADAPNPRLRSIYDELAIALPAHAASTHGSREVKA